VSKPVRIREFVAAPVAERAASENRSFANMVEVLLLAALTERGQRTNGALESGGADSTTPSSVPRSVSADVAATIPGVQIIRPHMKKNRPAVECPVRVVAGVCPDCGEVVT